MVKCSICGEPGKIFSREKWLCEKHYRKSKGKKEHIGENKLDKIKNKIDLGLKKLYENKGVSERNFQQ